MKKYIVIAIAVACLVGSQAKAATFTLNFAVQTLRDQNGNPVADTTLVLAVADTTGSGSAGLSNLVASTSTAQGGSIGSGYFVLSLAPNSTQGAVANGTVVQELALPLVTGQDVYLLWFPTLTTSSTTVGFNTPYGVLGGAAISAESVLETGDPWKVPAGGALVNLYATDTDGGGLLTASQLTANQISQVPEPSTIVLVGMGLLGALGLARRRS